jgi:hypothetical protein
MSSRRLMLITIGLALVVLARIGWAVQGLRLPVRGLGALSTHLKPNRNHQFPSKGTENGHSSNEENRRSEAR